MYLAKEQLKRIDRRVIGLRIGNCSRNGINKKRVMIEDVITFLKRARERKCRLKKDEKMKFLRGKKDEDIKN